MYYKARDVHIKLPCDLDRKGSAAKLGNRRLMLENNKKPDTNTQSL